MSEAERAAEEERLAKKIDLAWDAWHEALRRLHSLHERARRAAVRACVRV
eukprot:COSAG01_NODE_251_length_20305_cov_5.846447_13_plen_50_part_00